MRILRGYFNCLVGYFICCERELEIYKKLIINVLNLYRSRTDNIMYVTYDRFTHSFREKISKYTGEKNIQSHCLSVHTIQKCKKIYW